MSRFQILHSCLRQAMIVHQANRRFGSREWFCGVMWWLKLKGKTIDWHMHSGAGQSDYPSGAVRFAVDGRTLQVLRAVVKVLAVYLIVLFCACPVEKQYRNWNTMDYLNFGVLVTLGPSFDWTTNKQMLGFYWDSGHITQSVKRTQADKFLLAARSEYFERMLRTGDRKSVV